MGRGGGRGGSGWSVAWLVDSRPPGQRQYNLEGEGTVASRSAEVTAYIDTLLACIIVILSWANMLSNLLSLKPQTSAQYNIVWQAIISSFGRFLTGAVATVACFYISIIGTGTAYYYISITVADITTPAWQARHACK